MAHTLRVMTYNTHGSIGSDGRLDAERVAATIEAVAPDVVALQEVHRTFSPKTAFVDQAEWFADRLGMRWAFGNNVDRGPVTPAGPSAQYGTLLLSRYPVAESDTVLLPRRPGSEQRGLLRIRIEPGGVPVWVCNVHLQHDSAAERVAQIEVVRREVSLLNGAVVLMGDLNAVPSDEEIRAITRDLLDVWRLVGSGAGHTRSAANPRRRIDYILVSDTHVTPMSARVLTSLASDHLPVVAELALAPSG